MLSIALELVFFVLNLFGERRLAVFANAISLTVGDDKRLFIFLGTDVAKKFIGFDSEARHLDELGAKCFKLRGCQQDLGV